jgi:P-type Na+/K+ transporter
LEGGGGVKWPKILLKQIVNAMMLVLLLALGVSFGIKSFIEGGVVTAVVILNVVVGFFQEYSAEKTMESLRGLSSPSANVIRQGNAKQIPSPELVPGDLIEVYLPLSVNPVTFTFPIIHRHDSPLSFTCLCIC